MTGLSSWFKMENYCTILNHDIHFDQAQAPWVNIFPRFQAGDFQGSKLFSSYRFNGEPMPFLHEEVVAGVLKMKGGRETH